MAVFILTVLFMQSLRKVNSGPTALIGSLSNSAFSGNDGGHDGSSEPRDCQWDENGWAPKGDQNNCWLQVDLGDVYIISSIRTKGCDWGGEWTTRYDLYYGTNTNNVNNNVLEDLDGNSNADSTKTNNLNPDIVARYLRFEPQSSNSWPCMRVEAFGITQAPTPAPTSVPTPAPTAAPTPSPTPVPTTQPTRNPTHSPTPQPSLPTDAPTSAPTIMPTPAPTQQPIPAPTRQPSVSTDGPSMQPTMLPTSAPTNQPSLSTQSPTGVPTNIPTISPTNVPTQTPTNMPSEYTNMPTQFTGVPSSTPTKSPVTPRPTLKLSFKDPTNAPTKAPLMTVTNAESIENASMENNAGTNYSMVLLIGIAAVISLCLFACLCIVKTRRKRKRKHKLSNKFRQKTGDIQRIASMSNDILMTNVQNNSTNYISNTAVTGNSEGLFGSNLLNSTAATNVLMTDIMSDMDDDDMLLAGVNTAGGDGGAETPETDETINDDINETPSTNPMNMIYTNGVGVGAEHDMIIEAESVRATPNIGSHVSDDYNRFMNGNGEGKGVYVNDIDTDSTDENIMDEINGVTAGGPTVGDAVDEIDNFEGDTDSTDDNVMNDINGVTAGGPSENVDMTHGLDEVDDIDNFGGNLEEDSDSDVMNGINGVTAGGPNDDIVDMVMNVNSDDAMDNIENIDGFDDFEEDVMNDINAVTVGGNEEIFLDDEDDELIMDDFVDTIQ